MQKKQLWEDYAIISYNKYGIREKIEMPEDAPEEAKKSFEEWKKWQEYCKEHLIKA